MRHERHQHDECVAVAAANFTHHLPCAAVVFCFFSSRRRHTRFDCDWSSDVCSSDLFVHGQPENALSHLRRATQLDAEFAMAWIYLATVAGTQRQDQAAFEAASRAYEIGRASCRERV